MKGYKGWKYESGRHGLAARGIKTMDDTKWTGRKIPLKDYPLAKYSKEKVNERFYRVDNVPPTLAETWMGIAFNPEDSYNDAPTQKEIINIVKKYKGTLNGFVIPIASERDDARIEFDGFTIPCSEKIAQRLFHELTPDAFYYIKNKGWHFWWD